MFLSLLGVSRRGFQRRTVASCDGVVRGDPIAVCAGRAMDARHAPLGARDGV